MEFSELLKLVEHEIQWLSYYGYREDRNKLTIDSDIYQDIKSIGYTKRKIALIERCSPGLITSNDVITKDTNISELFKCCFPKGDNMYTPLEVYLILFPNEKSNVINRLKPEPIVLNTFYSK